MDVLHVFVDEYGDPNLQVGIEGVSQVYIVAAVCIWGRNLEKAKLEAESIRSAIFQSGEMKSSGIGSNESRRIETLSRLGKIDAFVIAFCADKEKAWSSSGLQFKKSFIKFFAAKMQHRISAYSDDIRLVTDKHGTREFQGELKKYLIKKFPGDLFSKFEVDVVDSKENVLLQVADVYAGSLARIYDAKKRSEASGTISKALEGRFSISIWPSGDEPQRLPMATYTEEVDELIRRYCIRKVSDYLSQANQNSGDIEELARSEFMRILLANHAWNTAGEFLSTKILLREISKRVGERITEHKFRSSIVARLRDSDVIVASCAKGYKIPESYSDVREFALFANTIVPPMISRIEKARRGIFEATMGKCDLLAGEELGKLDSLVKAFLT